MGKCFSCQRYDENEEPQEIKEPESRKNIEDPEVLAEVKEIEYDNDNEEPKKIEGPENHDIFVDPRELAYYKELNEHHLNFDENINTYRLGLYEDLIEDSDNIPLFMEDPKKLDNAYYKEVKEHHPCFDENINKYLVGLYENDLKFKRPDAEVECITCAVETIIEQIMTAVGNKDQTCQISYQYLVGSMAERTSILEPDEFDFLVVLKHFSKQSGIDIKWSHQDVFQVNKKGRRVDDLDNFVEKLHQVIPSLCLQSVDDFGKLSIKSSTVCRHGPASVIKLLWEPSSKTSKSLDILVDITPCIEQHGIDTVIQASDVSILARFKALVRDNKYMLLPKYGKFVSTCTTTEVKLVQTLSAHHKM